MRPRLRILIWTAAALATAIVALLADAWTAMGGRPDRPRRARMERSPRWNDGRFVNPQPLRDDTWGALRDIASGSAHRVPREPVPVEQVDPARFQAAPPSGLRVTWLGHSTLLVEVDGRRILVDPVWGERASPLSWLGPRRSYAPLPGSTSSHPSTRSSSRTITSITSTRPPSAR